MESRMRDGLDAQVDSARAMAKGMRAYGREDTVTLAEELVTWVEAQRAAFRVKDQESFDEAHDKADALRDQIGQKLGAR